jgi:hypothetical protein
MISGRGKVEGRAVDLARGHLSGGLFLLYVIYQLFIHIPGDVFFQDYNLM